MNYLLTSSYDDKNKKTIINYKHSENDIKKIFKKTFQDFYTVILNEYSETSQIADNINQANEANDIKNQKLDKIFTFEKKNISSSNESNEVNDVNVSVSNPTEIIKIMFRTRKNVCQHIISNPKFRKYCIDNNHFLRFVDSEYVYSEHDYAEIMFVFYVTNCIPTSKTIFHEEVNESETIKNSTFFKEIFALWTRQSLLLSEIKRLSLEIEHDTIKNKSVEDLKTILEELNEYVIFLKGINSVNFNQHRYSLHDLRHLFSISFIKHTITKDEEIRDDIFLEDIKNITYDLFKKRHVIENSKRERDVVAQIIITKEKLQAYKNELLTITKKILKMNHFSFTTYITLDDVESIIKFFNPKLRKTDDYKNIALSHTEKDNIIFFYKACKFYLKQSHKDEFISMNWNGIYFNCILLSANTTINDLEI